MYGMENTPRPTGRRSIRQRSSRPLVTYGKKTGRLLPLNASQFRPSAYDILVEPDDVDKQQKPLLADREMLATEGRSHRGMGVPAGELRSDPPAAVIEGRPRRIILHDGNSHHCRSTDTSNNPPKPLKAIHENQPGPKTQLTSLSPETVSTTAREPSHHRRLPVQELTLIKSPPQGTREFTRSRTPVDAEARDPITDHTSSPTRDPVPAVTRQETRCTAHRVPRNRTAHKALLKAPRAAFKSIERKLRLQHTLRAACGDGFDTSELQVRGMPKIRRKRKPRSPSTLALARLQLTSGPLPDVEFHDYAVELDMVTDNKDITVKQPSADMAQAGFQRNRTVKHGKTHNESDDLAKEQMIFAQLSSISAPARPVSEYAEDEEPNESDEWSSFEDDEDDNAFESDHNGDHEIKEVASTDPERPNPVITPNFRGDEEHHSGLVHSRSCSTQLLMEVDDPLVELQPWRRRDNSIDPTPETEGIHRSIRLTP